MLAIRGDDLLSVHGMYNNYKCGQGTIILLNGRLKSVPFIKVTLSDKTVSFFFARDLHQHSTSTPHSITIHCDSIQGNYKTTVYPSFD
ncbi:hypothetical protein DAPPUDRAFT_322043 [Daphnia pulex]|uniref:Uncharacterized protein n=1 Tax=Daphnia pulex TaxID=6669 RepID=E9GUF4_DAPPU|nr:hypothetical protein DAPPUDRAFT_322043 [Daphnia pulex]|eukprot:EFX76822.1 hypothetical protein DAPPUDRAFT_322043 [Daphnia pulex]